MFQKRTLRLPTVTKYLPSSEKETPYTLDVILLVATDHPVYRNTEVHVQGGEGGADNGCSHSPVPHMDVHVVLVAN